MPPSPPPPPSSNRRLLVALVAIAAAGVLIGWLTRGVDRARDPAHGARADRADASGRSRGPSAGPLAPRPRPGAGGRVLGVLPGAVAGLVVVEGTVVDASSRAPVGGVEVVFGGPAGEVTTAAADDGTYRVEVEPGTYRAFVRGDGVISVGAAPLQRLPAPPDPLQASAPDDDLAVVVAVRASLRGVDLEVQRAGAIVGRVVDDRGRPLAGAVVHAEGGGGWRPVLGTHVAETDATGAFRLELPAGHYQLDAAHPSFAGAAADPATGARPGAMVYPAGEAEVTLTLARGCVITGRVVRADGTPAGAGAIERAFGGGEFYPAGQVADDGTFRYTMVDPGELTLRAWPWKSPPAPARTLACHDGARHVVEFVVPDRAPDLSGVIVDARGARVGGAHVDIWGLTAGTMNQQELADAHGDWAVYALPPGEYAVTAYVPGHGIATARATVPGRGVELRLTGTGAIAGRVSGVPDGGTFVLEIAGCFSAHGHVLMPPSRRVVAVHGGAFRVDDLPACHLSGLARTATRTVGVAAEIEAGGATPVDVDLEPPRAKTIEVTVVDDDGRPVAGAQVMVASMGSGVAVGVAETDGRGRATVRAHVDDYVSVFAQPPGGEPLIGYHLVTGAAGAVEHARVVLSPYDPRGP